MGENRWMLAVVGRCAGYGARMWLYFLLLSLFLELFLVTILFWYAYVTSPDFAAAPYFYWMPMSDPWAIFCLGSGLIGAMGGAIAGFNSPPRDLESRFFKSVFKSGAPGLCYGFSAGFCASIVLPNLTSIFYPGLLPLLVLGWVGQIYGIGRGIRLARATAAASRSLESADA